MMVMGLVFLAAFLVILLGLVAYEQGLGRAVLCLMILASPFIVVYLLVQALSAYLVSLVPIVVIIIVGVVWVKTRMVVAAYRRPQGRSASKRLVAEHEAGHCKAIHAYGGRIKEVRIGLGASLWGYTAISRIPRGGAKQADISLAGPYAEHLHTGESLHRTLDYGIGHEGSDYDRFRYETWGGGKGKVVRHGKRLSKVIKRDDPGIKALADVLEVTGRVSGGKAHSILRKARR